jgi:hypothetical protein
MVRAQKGDSKSGYPLLGRRLRSNLPRGGRSRGGMTTKIVALTDALGNLIDFRLLPGQAHERDMGKSW